MRQVYFGVCALIGVFVYAQTNSFTVKYNGIAPTDNSPFSEGKLGNIGIHNPERGFSLRAGLVDIYATNYYADAEILPAFYENVDGDNAKGLSPLSEYITNFEDDGISLVELEHYVRFTEDNLINQDPLSQDHLDKARDVIYGLKDQGVKAHLIMNSDFNYFSTGTKFNDVAPNSLRIQGLFNYIGEMGEFYREISPLVAMTHLGWVYAPWDFNSYRLSNKWKNQNYNIWLLYPKGDVVDVPYDGYEEIPNYHGELRESVQRTDWGAYHGGGGGPWNYATDFNHARKRIIDNILNYFPYQKVVTASALPWTNYIGTTLNSVEVNPEALAKTYEGPFNSGDYRSDMGRLKENGNYLRIGFYDEAFAGDSYSHAWSIPNGEVHQIHWHKGYKADDSSVGNDWRDNSLNMDAYIMRNYRHNFWVHGDLPIYETEDTIFNDSSNSWAWKTSSFTQHHTYFQGWYPDGNTGERNAAFDYEIGEAISSAKLQDPMMSALKMRYFNFTSFGITHNNLLDGRSPYEMTDGYNDGLEGIGIPRKENTAISGWKDAEISAFDAEYWHLPVSDRYFEDADGNAVNRTVYEYIRDHLGYRLELQQTAFTQTSTDLNIKTDLINRGFAAPQNPRKTFFVLLDGENEIVKYVELDVDWRDWQPDDFSIAHDNANNLDFNADYNSLDEIIIGGLPLGDFNSNWHHTPLDITNDPFVYSIEGSLDIEDLGEGIYTVGICMPDINQELFDVSDKYAVKFANAVPFLECSGVTVLGAIEVGDLEVDSDGDGLQDALDENPFNPIDFIAAQSGPMENCKLWLDIPVVDFEPPVDYGNISDLKVYPNPSFGMFNVEFSGLVTSLDVQVYNMVGQMVSAETYYEVSELNLDFNHLEKGTYIMAISGPEYNQFRKIVKK